MTSVQLVHLAHARSGDKGDTANVGVIAYDEAHYDLLREHLTVEAVKKHFGEMVKGEVERFELPNLSALNFLLHGRLICIGAAIWACIQFYTITPCLARPLDLFRIRISEKRYASPRLLKPIDYRCQHNVMRMKVPTMI